MERLFSQYGRVFDLLPEMILILDDQERIIDLNKAAAAELGVADYQINDKSIFDIVEPVGAGHFRGFLRTGHDNTLIESKFVKSDRSVADVSVELKFLNSGIALYRVLIARDITELKKKELDLLRFSNVIHSTINPIQITDAKGHMVYVNPAFEEVTGYMSAELLGKNPSVLSSGKHDREFWAGVWHHIMSGKVWVGRLENKRKDGTPFYTELVISPIVDQRGHIAGFMGAHRDLTEQKMLEQQLVRSQKMESIGTLAAGIAHEVGNPLTAISSLVQVIQRTSKDEFAKDKLELINSQINRITRIIRDLVDFSRPSTHVTKPVNVNGVLRDALNIVQYGKKVKDIKFDMVLNEALPSVEVVPDQLVQVFINILMNAVDALDDKPGTITVRSRATDEAVEIEISDTGKGIAAEAAEKIFEPFYTTKGVGQGTGLGLWVSYGIVESFGGDIRVDSLAGKGSSFTIMLPRKQS